MIQPVGKPPAVSARILGEIFELGIILICFKGRGLIYTWLLKEEEFGFPLESGASQKLCILYKDTPWIQSHPLAAAMRCSLTHEARSKTDAQVTSHLWLRLYPNHSTFNFCHLAGKFQSCGMEELSRIAELCSAQVSITLQKGLDIRPTLHRIRQLLESRILLQPLHPILRQILIMQNLVNNHIRIRERLPHDIWPLERKLVPRQVSLEGLQEANALGLLVLGISLFFIRVEKRADELSPPCNNNKSVLTVS